jgi:hypothetical protein
LTLPLPFSSHPLGTPPPHRKASLTTRDSPPRSAPRGLTRSSATRPPAVRRLQPLRLSALRRSGLPLPLSLCKLQPSGPLQSASALRFLGTLRAAASADCFPSTPLESIQTKVLY